MQVTDVNVFLRKKEINIRRKVTDFPIDVKMKRSTKNKTENFLFLKPLGLWNSIKAHLNILRQKKARWHLRTTERDTNR